MDAGTDAGGMDAGTDAGGADAGADAGMLDGGADMDGGIGYGLSGGAGCSAPGGTSGGGLPWAALGVLGLLVWRRRRG
jgi:MYXO-CTERM domain-containing protein